MTTPLSEESEAFLGMLKTFEFRHEGHMANPDLGPKRLVTSAVADPASRLPACVSRSAASYLLGRDLEPSQEPWVDELSSEFLRSGMSYRELVRSIVLSPVYRSLR